MTRKVIKIAALTIKHQLMEINYYNIPKKYLQKIKTSQISTAYLPIYLPEPVCRQVEQDAKLLKTHTR